MASIQSLPLPKDVTLPYFSYGLLKPGELAHKQIARFVDGRPVDATVAAGGS